MGGFRSCRAGWTSGGADARLTCSADVSFLGNNDHSLYIRPYVCLIVHSYVQKFIFSMLYFATCMQLV